MLLHPGKRPEKWPCAWWFEREARAAKDGGFAFEDVVFAEAIEVVVPTCDPKASPKWGGTVEPGKDVAGLVLRLPPVATFVVTVVDPAGAVIEGSAVTIYPGQDMGKVVTAADGTARLEVNGVTQVAVSAEPPAGRELRYLRTTKHWADATRGAFRLTLDEAGVASGLVLTPEGEPAPAIRILVSQGGGPISTALSGPDGRFECAIPLKPEYSGPVHLVVEPYRDVAPEVRAPDGRVRRVKGDLRDVRAGDTGLQLRLEWVDEAALEVLVLSPDEQPAGGATVYVYEQQVGEPRIGVTGADGRATFEGLPRVEFTITVEPPKTPEAADWMISLGPPGGAVPGDELVEIGLPRGCRVKGLILRPDGSPASGARLQPSHDALGFYPWTPRGGFTAGPDGRFSFLVRPDIAKDFEFRAFVEAERLQCERTVDATDLKEDLIVQLVKEP